MGGGAGFFGIKFIVSHILMIFAYYVIGYACKGNATLSIEKKQVKDFALR